MGKQLADANITFYFCDGGSCQKAGSEAVVRSIRAYLRNNKRWDNTHTIKTRCNGRCEDAPTCIVQGGNYWYKKLDPQKGLEIVKSHLTQDKPVEEYLLYQNGWETHQSDRERKPVTVKAFDERIDEELGACQITKGFASDQYLFPLFLYLCEHPEQSHLQLASGEIIAFQEVKAIRYTQAYAMEVMTEKATHEFVIAPIPKTKPELQASKITVAEYFYQESTQTTGVRLKNKFGERIATIFFGPIDSKAWQYCTEIQLLGQQLNPVSV